MKISVATIFACLVGGIAVATLPLADIAPLSGGLAIVFSILAGLLAQMIALTAVIFEPRRMSEDSVREIGKEVHGLQTLNIGLFAIYLMVLLLLTIVGVLSSHSKIANSGWSIITVDHALLFATGACIVLATIRTFRTLFAIRTLQDLRVEAQAKEAAARDKMIRNEAAERLRPVPDEGGAEYGTYVGGIRKRKNRG